jgi:hypothetical protein
MDDKIIHVCYHNIIASKLYNLLKVNEPFTIKWVPYFGKELFNNNIIISRSRIVILNITEDSW